MPAIITKGAFSAQGYGFGASASGPATYIEDVFSTYLYAGTSATQTITNNINLSSKRGLVWTKSRAAATNNNLWTVENDLILNSDNTAAGSNNAQSFYGLTANVDGYTIASSQAQVNGSSYSPYVSWTFRKQPKFFDIVTYTGDGVAGRTVAHNLGSEPGMIIVKCTSQASNWLVYHSSTTAAMGMFLNATNAGLNSSTYWNYTAPTSSVFSVGTSPAVNGAGQTYVAYLFAHNAGGFGAAGTDNVISCGSYTGNGSATGPTVTLGYEPQYVMVKCSSATGNWVVLDVMRGMSQTASNELFPNLSDADTALNPSVIPTATGFTLGTTNAALNSNGATYIYMAIRRGPMKTPTDATKVFSPITSSAATSTQQTTGFPIDLQIEAYRNVAAGKIFVDRLRGVQTVVTTTVNTPTLASPGTSAEVSAAPWSNNWNNTGFAIPDSTGSSSAVYWNFQRAPGFFDEVCYTGNGVANRTISHNLGVAPQLLIVKSRSSTWSWYVWYTGLTSSGELNSSAAFSSANTAGFFGNNTTTVQPTSSVFTLGSYSGTNQNNTTYLTYLFATLSGVSKVGTYTGTGAAQNIDCGFAASARFILIKRTDSTGDWYVYDSARGISASNDPYLLLSSTAAEVTNTNYVGTYATGFSLTSTAPAELNASGGSYLFLAIA